MASHEKRIDFHKIKFVVSKSKKAFLDEYKKYKLEFYSQILNELEKAIKEDKLEDLEILCKALTYVYDTEECATLIDFYDNIENSRKHMDFIILACKHNKIRILELLLYGIKNEILNELTEKSYIFPSDDDETGHNAFYYAIRLGNTELLETLIKWASNISDADPEMLEGIVSKAYEELKLKNVLLTEEMEISVQNKLLDMRFFSNANNQNQSIKNIDSIRGRIELVLEVIASLNDEYSNTQVDEKFLYMAKFVAKNIHVLKRLLKSTYNRLPWEEIEFCLISYICSHTKVQEINIFYHATLDKDKILMYLKYFAKRLEEVKDIALRGNVKKLSVLPKINREKAQAKIIGLCPQFRELYENHRQIRDVYSLQKIYHYISLASLASPKERGGQLIILRALQVMGENVKNTWESPKLSAVTSELLLHTLPLNTRNVIKDLRNSLSHVESLFKRIEIEANADKDYFIGIQKDVKSVGEEIFEILFSYKTKMVKKLLQRIVDSENLSEIKKIMKMLDNAKLIETNFAYSNTLRFEELDPLIKQLSFACSNMSRYEELERLVKELSDNVSDKTVFEEQLLNEIYSILDKKKNKSKNNSVNYIIGFESLKCFKRFLTCNNAIKRIKFNANKLLEYFNSVDNGCEVEPQNLKMITQGLMSMFSKYYLRIDGSNESINNDRNVKLDKMTKLMYKFIFIAEFGIGDIKWIKDFREKLKAINSSNLMHKQTSISAEKLSNQLVVILSELTNILTNNSFGGKALEELPVYTHTTNLQVSLEMLVLDLMSILESTKNKLEENLFFLDENAPSLTGKSLRNHLAHDNVLIDALLFEPTTAIVLNAKKFVEKNILESKQKIGKLIFYNFLQLKMKYNEDLFHITNQNEFFQALTEGNLKKVKDSLKTGADVKARNNNLWSALHFASMGPSLEVVKFILNQNSDICVEDINGQIPLHIAAAHGRKAIVEYFVEELGLDVDYVENSTGRTSLHIAAQNGHKETVEILLKNKANAAAHDIDGFSPLCYAIINNHTNIAKILLNKDINVNINEATGGFTPLHCAAESGNVDLIHFLLQNQAYVNVVSDNHYTPLHTAALNGHLDVVKALIFKGANVNARVLDGCTPLHYAVETNHQEIVEILLKHGAKTDIVDKTFLNAPIHYAAHDGLTRITQALLKYNADVQLVNDKGFTPLHLAAKGGHLEIGNILINHEVNIDSRDKNNNTPLHIAVICGHKEIVEVLHKNGAEINACAHNDITPLFLAAMIGQEDIVSILIKYQANVNVRDSKGRTLLHAAAISGNRNVINILIKNKLDVNARSSHGITPLHGAVFNNVTEAIVTFIENNAEIEARDLLVAIVAGHEEVVNILVQNKAEINRAIFEKMTPLHIAVKFGYKEITEILIKNGVNVNKMCDGCSPLCYAVMHNYEEIVKILIANGADVNAVGGYLRNAASNVDDYQLSKLTIKDQHQFDQILPQWLQKLHSTAIPPLSIACYFGYTNIVKLLLKHKARVNAKCVGNETTPLHAAAAKGHKEIVRILIEKGAIVDPQSSIFKVTPLYFAAEGGHDEIVKMLITNGAKVNIHSYDGATPLHIAAVQGHSNVVKVLLEGKANVKLKDGKDRTALEQAVAHGHLQVVKLLLQYKKENINARGNNGWTLLHIASQYNNLEIVKYLTDEGADIHVKSPSGAKSIHYAAREGFKDTVEFFLKMGLNINEPGFENQTLLHYATVKEQVEVVRYLIMQRANVNAKDENSRSPLYFAAKYGHKNILKILLENGAIYDAVDKIKLKPFEMFLDKAVLKILVSSEKLFEVVRFNNFLDVQNLIKEGAIVNVRNSENETPLHFAAWKGNDKIVKILLQNKANINAKNKKKHTPLHYAAKYSHLNVIITLLCNGAMYNAASVSGKTPTDLTADEDITSLFHLVSESFQNVKNNNSEVIDHLNEMKDIPKVRAVMNAQNEEGKTLIVVALYCNFSKVEKLKQVLQGDISVKIYTALILLNQGDCHKALSIFNDILEKRKKILGTNNPGTLDIELHIVKVLYKLGSYQQALNMIEDIYQKQKDILGENAVDTLSTRSTIALILHRQGSDEEALEIFRDVYQKQKQVLGQNHSDTLNTQFHMALALNSLGNYEEALHINRYVFLKRKEILGSNSLETIAAQNNIALVLMNQNENEQALKIYKEVFEKKKKVLGMNHPDTLRTLQSTAGIFFKQKKYHEALKTYEQVLQLQKDILQPNHPEILLTQCSIVNLLCDEGKFVNAFKIYTQVSDLVTTTFEPTHPVVSQMFKNKCMMDAKFKLQGTSVAEVLEHLQEDVKVAVNNEDIQTLQHLLKNGYNVNETDRNGKVQGTSVAEVLEHLQNDVKVAINNEDVQTLQRLLKNDFNVSETDTNCKLHSASVAEVLEHVQKDIKVAVNNGDVQTLQRLLKNVSNVNETDPNGRTVLHFAVSNNQTDIVKTLLMNGADVFQVTNKGNSLLHLATLKNNAEIVEILLKHVAHDKLHEFINMKTTLSGTTSLHVAAKNGSLEIVTILLKHGAIYNIENKESKTPVDLTSDHQIVNLLNLIEELFRDAKTGEIVIIDKLRGLKPDEFFAVMKAQDKQGNTISQIVTNCKNVYENISSKLREMSERQS